MQLNVIFLHELGMSEEEEAFLSHNFAPPKLRRNIGVLGLLHKRVLGRCHPMFQRLFPFHVDVCADPAQGVHNKILYNHFKEVVFQQSLHSRSIFGMVYVYNHLPQHVVDCATISCFQRLLTKAVRRACEQSDPAWQDLLSCLVNLVHTVNMTFDFS